MPLSNLNEEQLAAATCERGFNLIIASDGTGKTSTIVGRIENLINNGVKPDEILLLTFTNKAAQEMVQRVGKFFGKEVAKQIMAGTFHSVSYKLLKQLNKNITLKQPNELKTLFKSIYEKRVFVEREEDTNPYDGGYLYDMYSLYLNSNDGESFGDWIKNYKGELKASDNLITGIKRGYYFSDGKFLYSTNSEMMLLLQMYLGDAIRNIQEYITEDELDEQH